MTVLAHASGTGWDEVVLTAAPFAVSTVLLVLLRHRLNTDDGGAGRRPGPGEPIRR